MMHVLMGSARHCKPSIFVVNEAPDQIVQRPQGIEFEFPKRIVWRTTPVLESPGDCVHGLNEHPFFKPIRPNQLDEAGQVTTVPQDAQGVGQDLMIFSDRG